jgi:hydrogenase expression/formation protein HypD
VIKFINEYRDKDIVRSLITKIREVSVRDVRLMEVCGGHTMAVQKFGLTSLLPKNVKLISGPGCPVCVTSKGFIDNAILLGRKKEVILTTFGDLIRVPGTESSLEREKAQGTDVRIVYSSLEAIKTAKENPAKKVIFLGIGFETTAPTSAAAILKADEISLKNFYLLSAHKIMPPAMKALVSEGIPIDGYICPGHVSTITGSGIYRELAVECRKPCVIAGFEPTDILMTVYMLLKQISENRSEVEIQYKRAVKPEGNTRALEMMNKVFLKRDDWWRGLGIIPGSGLGLGQDFEKFDAEKYFGLETLYTKDPEACICGEILKGLKNQLDCRLFAKTCNPEDPVGACMVSGEGTCQAYFRYSKIATSEVDRL